MSEGSSEATGPLLTVDEVAGRLRTCHKTVLRLIQRREFQQAFRIGRRWRIPDPDVLAYLARCRTGHISREV